MSGVRVLVGTHKGAFILTSDAKRTKWDISGPLFAGWEIYHINGSPADPQRLYASQSNGWSGQVIQRSNDGGKTWEAVGNEFKYEGVPGTHQWYDGTQHPWEFKRIWHLEPSLTDPDTVYAGAEDAALFRTGDGGRTWQGMVDYGQSATAQFYSGSDTFSTQPQEVAQPIRYDWKYLGGSVSITKTEQLENSGPVALASLLDTRMKQLNRTFDGKLLIQAINGCQISQYKIIFKIIFD